MKKGITTYTLFLLIAFVFTFLLIVVIGFVTQLDGKKIVSLMSLFHDGMNLVTETPFFIINVIIVILVSHLLFTTVLARLVAVVFGAFILIVGIGMIDSIARFEYQMPNCKLPVNHLCKDITEFKLQIYSKLLIIWTFNMALKFTVLVLAPYSLFL